MHIIQQKLLRLIDTYDLGNLSFRDIGKIIDNAHPQMIKHHLEQLEKRKLIKWDKTKKIITKTNPGAVSNSDFVTVPILGSASCGEARAFADEHIEGHIKVSTKLVKNKRDIFAIRAIGSSMNRASVDGKSIEDGDYVIVDPTDGSIENNDYVLSIIDDVANVKKIEFDPAHSQIVLSSESSNAYPPIYIHESEAGKYLVNGKVVQVIKQKARN